MKRCDLSILNGIVVFPNLGPVRADIGVTNGVISQIADSISASQADEVIDANGNMCSRARSTRTFMSASTVRIAWMRVPNQHRPFQAA